MRVLDVGLRNVHDSIVLAWAAQEKRIVLTHDVNTLLTEARLRVAEGLFMPGVLASPQAMAVAPVINDLIFIAEESADGEWEGEIVFLPV